MGGAEEIRTPDPHVANVVLYQLSYRPICRINQRSVNSNHRTRNQLAL